jgi:ABC-type multidrug transport system fused ATPase/permease subunit
MDNQQGAELNQLSRILFDRATDLWQRSIILELVVGIIGVAVSIAQPSLNWSTVGAIIVVVILCFGYYFRYKFEEEYDIAETMRRQSVLSEALNWPISRAQFNEWKSRAGKKILKKFSLKQRASNYYGSTQDFGPKKLAEMTFESVFWTKNLYRKIKFYVLSLLIAIVAIFILLISLSIIPYTAQDLRVYLVYTIYLLIPVLLTIDFLGLVLKSHRSIHSLNEIEKSLEKISQEDLPKIEEVMRLVSEYNCVVSTGIPIPNWLFKLHHNEIARFWS